MFYSHQLLAKKAPLGQIWMAATLHAKINRRKLDKLDIIKICEEILNPQVPMALRLSGILMGGVVIVYEKKVKLLYDDATRFLMEVNEAGKVKPAVDRTLLPKNRAQAKYEAVTLPAVDMEVEHSVPFISDANTPVARFRSMRLDDLDEQFIHIDPRDDEEAQNHHQVDAANITLFDDLNTNAETYLNDRFERFDIGEDEIQMNVHEQEEPTLRPPPREVQHPKAPSSHISSPATHHEPTLQDEPMMEEQDVQHPDVHMNAPNDETEGTARKQQHKRRKPREWANQIIIDEQVMITGNVYQSWLQDTSSIKRRRRTKPRHPIFTTKTDILWDLPPVALLNGLENFPTELYYPEPLLKLWRKGNQASPARSSPSGVTPPERQQNPASHSPPAALSHRNNIPEYPPGDFHSEVGSQPSLSIERGMVNEFQAIFDDAHITPSGHFNTSTSPAGASSGSIPSSGSGHSFQPYEQEEILPPFTKNKRRQFSSARSELGNLETVEEEFPVVQDVRSLKIPRISQNRLTNDSDLLEETMPTQTPIPVIAEPSIDKITQSICSHLKLHFDTPGNPQSESLDQLSIGMTKKKAAQLFYQTCVMATLDFVKVDQKEAYGDILISKGPKM